VRRLAGFCLILFSFAEKKSRRLVFLFLSPVLFGSIGTGPTVVLP
jgi:hypothetical protein